MSYRDGTKIAGIIFMHRISNTRMQGSALRNLHILKKICGDDFFRNIFLLTTFWDEVDESTGLARERELEHNPYLWGRMIEHGSQIRRGCRDRPAILALLMEVLFREATSMRIQRELVEQGANLEDTAAAALVYGKQYAAIKREHHQTLQSIQIQHRFWAQEQDLAIAAQREQQNLAFEEKLRRQKEYDERLRQDHYEKMRKMAEEKRKIEQQKRLEKEKADREQRALEDRIKNLQIKKHRIEATKNNGFPQATNHQPCLNLRFGNKYMLTRMLNRGRSGGVYLGLNIITGEQFAVKLESINTAKPHLMHEASIYHQVAGCFGIPHVRWFGTELNYNVMVMDLLGPTLKELFNFCDRKFSLKTVLLLADQLISRLEHLHARSYIHRDVRASNFIISQNKKNNQVSIIGFGRACRYRDERTLHHIPYREDLATEGYSRYMSINRHLGVEPSRRDDMVALAYLLIFWAQRSLPWQNVSSSPAREHYNTVMEMKIQTSAEALCSGLPTEFARYLEYTCSLQFSDKPDYAYARKLFRDVFIREGFRYDYIFDWIVYKYQRDATNYRVACQGHDK